MLNALIAGKALPAGELAGVAGVSPATASEHLARLRENGLVTVTKSGRHRYFQLASPDVARVIEALASISPPRPASSLRQTRADAAMLVARTCYDHLAGRLGVEIYRSLADQHAFEVNASGMCLTSAGEQRLVAIGIDVDDVGSKRREYARECLDFTERTSHLAGAVGAAICTRMFEIGWVVRRTAGSRALRLTDDGLRGFAHAFDINLSRPRSAARPPCGSGHRAGGEADENGQRTMR
jgi:DNA-binding transcriptional ArsR family regulator